MYIYTIFFLFRTTPVVHGGSQASDLIGATAASGLHTATATQDPSHICDLHHSAQQCQILNPLSKARDQTRNLTVPSWIRFCCMQELHTIILILYICI